MAEVIAPTVPKCHSQMNEIRLTPQSSRPANNAPVRPTPAERTAATPNHGNAKTNQKISAAP